MAILGPLMALVLAACPARAVERGRDAPVLVVPSISPSVSAQPLNQLNPALGVTPLDPALTLPNALAGVKTLPASQAAASGAAAAGAGKAAATGSIKAGAAKEEAFDPEKTQRVPVPIFDAQATDKTGPPDFDPEKTQRIDLKALADIQGQGPPAAESALNSSRAALDALFDNLAASKKAGAGGPVSGAVSGSAFSLLSVADKASPLDAPALYRQAAQAAHSLNPEFRKSMLRAIAESASQRADRSVHDLIKWAFDIAKGGEYKKEVQGAVADAMGFWTQVLERSGQWPLKDPVAVQAALTYIQSQAAAGRDVSGWKLSFTKILSEKPIKLEVNIIDTAQGKLAPAQDESEPAALSVKEGAPSLPERYYALRAEGRGRVLSALGAAFGALASGARAFAELVGSWFSSEREQAPAPTQPSSEALARLLKLRGEDILVHEGRGRAFEVFGYKLFHAPVMRSAPVKDETVKLRVRRGGSASEIEKLRKRFESFNRLIEANFAALELIAQNPKAMTAKQARAVYQRVLDMAQAYDEMTERSDLRAPGVKKHGQQLEALIGTLADSELIPEKALELVVPLEKRSLHKIINVLHQLALEKAGRADTGGAANFMVSLHRGAAPAKELALIDLSNDPLVDGGRIVSPGFKALAEALTRSADVPKGSLIMQDHQFWGHFKLGAHSAEIYANFLPPDEGGMIRIRYQEWGTSIENESRLYYVARILGKLGFTVNSDNGFLTAVVDKDHRSQTADEMRASFSTIIQALHATVGLDFAFPIILQGSTSEAESGRRIDEWVDIVLAEGGLPFYQNDEHEKMVGGFRDYQDKQRERVTLSMGLDAKLKELGLPPMPFDTPLGQAVIDKHYNEAIELALARGELSFRADGSLFRNKSWNPVKAFAVQLERGSVLPARMGEAVGSLDPSLLEYETIGSIGTLVAARAQRKLDSNTWLTIHALRDPQTGQVAFARAELGGLNAPPRPIPPEKLFAVLAEQGLPVAAFVPSDTPPGLGLYQRKLRQVPDASSGLLFNGLAASPGNGAPLVGIVTYDKRTAAEESRVFVAPYTSPDDLEAIRNSKAVLTTSGGLLSHAAITTREMGIAAAIFGQAFWKDGEMLLTSEEFSKPVIIGGLPIRSVKTRSHYAVAEGSVVRFDPASGALDLVLPKHQETVLALSKLLEAYDKNGDLAPLSRWLGRALAPPSGAGFVGGLAPAEDLDAREAVVSETLSALARRLTGRETMDRLVLLRRAIRAVASPQLLKRVERAEDALFFAERASVLAELRELQDQLREAGTLPGTERLLSAAKARLARLKLLAEALQRPAGDYAMAVVFHARIEEDGRKRMEGQLAADIKELELHARLYPTISVQILPRIKALVAKAKRRKLAPAYYERWEGEIARLEKSRRVARGKGPLVLPLSDVHDADAGFVGGKGAKLGEIAEVVSRAGAKTAAGFAITVEAYREFLKAAGIEAVVEGLAASEELPPEAKSERIQKLIREAVLTPDTALGRLLLEQLRASGLTGMALAVRSSAVDEDGAAAAFAGAGDTHLYVSEADMLEKVKEVWASLWNPRALLYRQTKGLSTTGLAQAVVVQAMVPSEVSGVAFTEDPVSGNPGRVVVNAAFGLGEGIVSGRVAPDQYVLLKSAGREILPPMISDKRVAVVRDESGRGVTEKRMPPSRRRARSLSPAQLEKLNSVARALEDHFGYALDIEFAFVGQELYILQARPVTTAAPAPKSLPQVKLQPGQGVVFVCAGNTCRSPMAAAMLRQELEDRKVAGVPVASRGLYAMDGEPMNELAREVLEERKIDGGIHLSAGLSAADVSQAGLLLVMEPAQREELLKRHPGAAGKVLLVSEFAGSQDAVADPIGGGRARYDETAAVLSQAVAGVASRLSGD
jgi:protein-tyrosine-phosphatase/phosphohistidine swiveling domain-containing protein